MQVLLGPQSRIEGVLSAPFESLDGWALVLSASVPWWGPWRVWSGYLVGIRGKRSQHRRWPKA